VALNERLRSLGTTLVLSTPEDFQQRIERDIAQWKRLAQAANITVQ
jgi:tripartite-type tricarboxylate transporter receptor subunit TctC